MGIRLKKLRTERALSQNMIVAMTGIPKSTYLRWEWGQGMPPLTSAVKLADALQITLDELVGRTPPPKKGTK